MSQTDLPLAVICMAAGESQIPVIMAAKALGYVVIAVDRNPRAPGFERADISLVLSTYKAEPIIRSLNNLVQKFRFVGIINRSSGPPVVTTSVITNTLGLPGIHPESARIAIDEGKLLTFCAKHGILAPCVFSLEANDDLPENLKMPVIVKPALSLVGKSGVHWVKHVEDLRPAVTEAMSCAVNGRVNIEQAVEGSDIVLMSLVHDGLLHPLVLLDEINNINDHGRVEGLAFVVPSRFHGTIVQTNAESVGQRFTSALRIETAPCMLSFRLAPNGELYLIEAHLDLGGDRILDYLLPASTEFDALEWLVKCLAGQFQPARPTFRPAAVVFQRGENLTGSRPFEVWKGQSSEELAQRIGFLKE